MKKILFAAILSLSLTVCLTSPAWAGGLADAKAGLTASLAGDYDEAIRLYTKAIESGELSQEQLSSAFQWRGIAWLREGDNDKAIADYTKAIKLNPKDLYVYYNRGLVWDRKGDYDKAIADCTKAIEINPKLLSAYNFLAWLMATCPDGRYRDGKRAIELAGKALKLKEASWTLVTLAAAYAEAGRFQDAIKTQEIAITKLKQEGLTKNLPAYEKQLLTYKAGKPWREK